TMPVAQLIAPETVQPIRRGRSGDGRAREEREAARAWLRQAREQDKAIELRLGSDERDETVKQRYRLVAKQEQLRVSLLVITQRLYRTRKEREEYEVEVLAVLVADREQEAAAEERPRMSQPQHRVALHTTA